jgi:hypothetical protein
MMDSTVQSMPQKPLSQLERVLFTFVSPTEAFTDMLRNRSWLLALAITVLTSYLYSYAVIQKVGLDQTVQNMVSHNATLGARLQLDTPAQRSAAISTSATITKWTMICEPLVVVLFNLLLAGIFLSSFNVVFNTQLKFGTVFCILIYADLINALKPVLTTVFLWIGAIPATQFDLQNPLGTNLGYFFPTFGNAALKSLMFSLDVFMIWYLAILAVGFAVAGRLKVGQAAAVVFSWWGVLVFSRIALASLGGN